MWKLFTILCLAAFCGADDPAEALYGEYKSIYIWAKLDHEVPNCNPIVFSKPSSSKLLESCKCGRQGANLVVTRIDLGVKKISALVDFVKSVDEMERAIKDKCVCAQGIDHDVAWRINENYVVHYDADTSKVYLLGKVVPSDDELKGLIDGFFWKDREGKRVCK